MVWIYCDEVWLCLTDGVDLLCAVPVSPVSSNAPSHRHSSTTVSNSRRHKVIWDDLEKSVRYCMLID